MPLERKKLLLEDIKGPVVTLNKILRAHNWPVVQTRVTVEATPDQEAVTELFFKEEHPA